MANFKTVIMNADFRPKFYLFDLNLLLALLCFVFLLVQVVKKLSVIHNPAYRGFCFWRYFNQVQALLLSYRKSLIKGNDPKLFFIIIYSSNFSGLDILIYSMLFFFTFYRMISSSSNN